MAKAPQQAKSLFNIKVTLRDLRPPIWRRLVVPGNMTLESLDMAIQAAMGWGGGHLHVFDIDGRQYGDPSILEDVGDENRMTIDRLVKAGISRFVYTYDFGDNWEHAVLIEKRRPAAYTGSVPACVAGARSCPPDDCGGPGGYEEVLDILSDPEHPDYSDWLEMFGENYDPEDFSVEEADARVAALCGRKAPARM